MHDNELTIDPPLVERLLSRQFPQWAAMPLQQIRSTGTVHAIYRAGDSISIRLPLLPEYESDVIGDWNWLPGFRSRLPVEIPEPLALGKPDDAYPLHWLIVRWIDGENATRATLRSLDSAAVTLGQFVTALRGTETRGKRKHHYRGDPLRLRDELTRSAIREVGNEYAEPVLNRAWNRALTADEWGGEPKFFHGDLHSGNLIARGGTLSAVIDFGALGIGDPAVDGIAGWWLFDGSSRERFRESGEFDRQMWDRARGWALSIALIALPYYRNSNVEFAEMARRAIEGVLSDLDQELR